MISKILPLLALAGTLSAADKPRMFATRVEIPERGEVPGYLCVLGTNKFSFISPTGWKPEARLDRREVIFISPELDASLTFRIVEGTTMLKASQTRSNLLERFSNTRVVEKFNCYAANQKGRGYVLEQTAADKGRVKIRYGVIPVPGGTAEFILRAPAVRIRDLHLVFGRFLASFQVEAYRPRS